MNRKEEIQEALLKAFNKIQKNNDEREDSLAKAIVNELPNQLLQDLHKRE